MDQPNGDIFGLDVEKHILGAKDGNRLAWVALVDAYRGIFGLVVTSHRLYVYMDKDDLWALAMGNLPSLVRNYSPGAVPFSFFYTGTRRFLTSRTQRARERAERTRATWKK